MQEIVHNNSIHGIALINKGHEMRFIYQPFFIIIVFLSSVMYSQSSNEGGKMKCLQGYQKVVTGGDFDYHSLHPGIKKALLVRHLKGENFIEWESEPIPSDLNDEFVSFIWFFGIANGAVDHKFDLNIDGQLCLSFNNQLGSEVGEWITKGLNNSSLTLKAVMVDKYSDLMGIAILKLPTDYYSKEKPLTFSVAGKDANSMSWYMTFQGKVENEILIKQNDLVLKEHNKEFNIVSLDIVHLGEEEQFEVELSNGFILKDIIRSGYNSFDLKFPELITREH